MSNRVSQSPSNRGNLSPLPRAGGGDPRLPRLNRLLIGGTFLSRRPRSAYGAGCRSQSPSNRGNLSQRRLDVRVRRPGPRLNPLLIGGTFLRRQIFDELSEKFVPVSQSPSNRGYLSQFSAVEVLDNLSLGLNPLLIGGTFLSAPSAAPAAARLNPLLIGGTFLRSEIHTRLAQFSLGSQSPSNRGNLSQL